MPDDTEKNHLVLLVTNRAVEEEDEDEEAGFRSNPKQRRFRETVEQCVAEKVIGLDKWIAAHRARHKETVTQRTFAVWSAKPGFEEWFNAALPSPLTSIERRLGDVLADRGMLERLASDDPNVAASAASAWKRPGKGGGGANPPSDRSAVLDRVRKK